MTQAWTWAGACAALSIVASWRAGARARRRNVDRPGWMPWQLVTVLAGMGALAAAVIAVRT